VILDVGCGTNPVGDVNVDFFREGFNPQTGDQKSGELMLTSKVKNFVVADAEHLPFKDSVFVVVFSSHVIEHVHNPFLMLKEMCRVSKRKVVVRCPHRKGSGAKRPFHLHYLDETWFKSAVTKLGFQCKLFIRAFDFPFTERIKLLAPRSWLKALESSLAFRALRRFERSLQRGGRLKIPLELEVWIQKKRSPSNSQEIVFVVVYNNPDIYQSCFNSSSYIFSDTVIPLYNDSRKALPALFNMVLQRFLNKDVWLVFCHQDFILQESLRPMLKGKDVKAVHGVIGARIAYSEFFGKIIQTNGVPIGCELVDDAPVETLDEMCLIVHSSAFRQGLMFDERFGFHFYGADLCMQAHNLGFEVVATQVKCQHKSGTMRGDVESMEYVKSLELFREKWRKALPVRTTTRIVEA
jgi:SAM-dependent methyltransferase